MNPFVTHPHHQGIGYTEHLLFAMGIALRLLRSVLAFAMHGIFPFVDIRRPLDLEATSQYLHERNNWIEAQSPRRQQCALEQQDSGEYASDCLY